MNVVSNTPVGWIDRDTSGCPPPRPLQELLPWRWEGKSEELINGCKIQSPQEETEAKRVSALTGHPDQLTHLPHSHNFSGHTVCPHHLCPPRHRSSAQHPPGGCPSYGESRAGSRQFMKDLASCGLLSSLTSCCPSPCSLWSRASGLLSTWSSSFPS